MKIQDWMLNPGDVWKLFLPFTLGLSPKWRAKTYSALGGSSANSESQLHELAARSGTFALPKRCCVLALKASLKAASGFSRFVLMRELKWSGMLLPRHSRNVHPPSPLFKPQHTYAGWQLHLNEKQSQQNQAKWQCGKASDDHNTLQPGRSRSMHYAHCPTFVITILSWCPRHCSKDINKWDSSNQTARLVRLSTECACHGTVKYALHAYITRAGPYSSM